MSADCELKHEMSEVWKHEVSDDGEMKREVIDELGCDCDEWKLKRAVNDELDCELKREVNGELDCDCECDEEKL